MKKRYRMGPNGLTFCPWLFGVSLEDYLGVLGLDDMMEMLIIASRFKSGHMARLVLHT